MKEAKRNDWGTAFGFTESFLRIRLDLLEFAESHSSLELLRKALDQISALTNSSVGFLHLLDEDQETLQLGAWSTRTISEFCTAAGKGKHYPICRAGVWVDCVREKRAVIHNDYASLKHRKGYPQGHPPIIRELVVPIMRGERVVAVLGVGNKPCDYTREDVEIASYLGDVAWAIAKRMMLEEELRRSHEELEMRVKERTAALRKSEERLRSLSGRLLTTQEEERKKIAAEIHDTIGSSLAAVKFSLESERSKALRENNKQVMDVLDRLIPITQSAIEETRRIHAGMRPPVLDDFGLILTIEWYCREFQKSYPKIHIERDLGIEETEIPESLKIVIFRIIQEALNNVAKYSKAELVNIVLSKAGESLELAVEDHGTGFDLNGVLSRDNYSGGLGLTSMMERASLSGGKLTIDSSPGRGTVIRGHW